MNFTCLCFDLKYSFKINCCNLLHISFGISEIWSCCCLLMPSDSVVDKSPPNSWCDNILCRTTLIDTAPPLVGINLRCCDLGTCTTNVRTQITRPHCVRLPSSPHLTQVTDLGPDQQTEVEARNLQRRNSFPVKFSGFCQQIKIMAITVNVETEQ